MQGYIRPDTKNRIRRLKFAIEKTAVKCPAVVGVWGFGSFFRYGRFSDIDLVLVISTKKTELQTQANYAKKIFKHILESWGIRFDIIVLTSAEFRESPLYEMDSLNALYRRNTHQ